MTCAARWLAKDGYEIVHIQDEIVEANVATWSDTLRTLSRKAVISSLKPNSLYLTTAKSFYQQFNKTQVNKSRLEEALLPYVGSAAVTGVRLGRLSEGNTRVVAFAYADDLSVSDVEQLASHWMDNAPAMQQVGRSPGQVYGEILIGGFTWGLTGFRFQQPVEIYPVLVFFDGHKYAAAKEHILRVSVREYIPQRSGAQSYVLRKAPVYLQTILACVPTGEVTYDADGRETRRAWRHYKKPKLAERVFGAQQLNALLRAGREE